MRTLVGRNPLPSQSSTALQGVIPHLPSSERARRLHGRRGKAMMLLQVLFHPLHSTLSQRLMFLSVSNCWNSLLSFSMTRPVTCKVLMKPEGCFFVRRVRQWRDYLQLRMPSCNIQNELLTRLEDGAPVSRVNKMHLLLKVGGGLAMNQASHGLLCGTPYLWLPKLAVN